MTPRWAWVGKFRHGLRSTPPNLDVVLDCEEPHRLGRSGCVPHISDQASAQQGRKARPRHKDVTGEIGRLLLADVGARGELHDFPSPFQDRGRSLEGGLIQTSVGRAGGCGSPRGKRSGWREALQGERRDVPGGRPSVQDHLRHELASDRTVLLEERSLRPGSSGSQLIATRRDSMKNPHCQTLPAPLSAHR